MEPLRVTFVLPPALAAEVRAFCSDQHVPVEVAAAFTLVLLARGRLGEAPAHTLRLALAQAMSEGRNMDDLLASVRDGGPNALGLYQ